MWPVSVIRNYLCVFLIYLSKVANKLLFNLMERVRKMEQEFVQIPEYDNEMAERWVSQFRVKTEPPSLWVMRKEFMQIHRGKYPDDELVKLANVFFNIEILECKYSAQLTAMVNKLAEQVPSVLEYREDTRRWNMRSAIWANIRLSKAPFKPCVFDGPLAIWPPSQIERTERERNIEGQHQRRANINEADWALLTRARCQAGWKGKLVLFECENWAYSAKSIAICSTSIQRAQLALQFEKIGSNNLYQMKINEEVVVECQINDERLTRAILCDAALAIMKNYCFTIVKTDPLRGETVGRFHAEQKTALHKRLADDNIGARIMRLMGWTGQGLGKDETGIQEPVQIARRLDLKSKSYGKINRQMVVQRELKPWEIVEDIMAKGGSCETYDLVRPENV